MKKKRTNCLFISEKNITFAGVIEIDRHIEILLLSNDCVIVPDLGGFMAHHIDARYDEREQLFLPPLRTLGFNPQLKMNDSLLVQSYIEAYDLSYPEALRRIETEVVELKQHLETEGRYELNDLGVLQVNDEGKLEFEPCEAGILTPHLYGLSSFEMELLAQQKDNAEDAAEAPTAKIEPIGQPSASSDTITIKMAWIRNLAATAAAIIAFFMMTTPVRNSTVEMQQSAFISLPSVSTVIPEPSAPQAVSPQDVPQSYFCLVLASQVSKPNAVSFIETLHNAGFDEAKMMETKSMRRVVYGSYATESEAYAKLRSLRADSRHFAEAWVLEVKN
ncbi:MAG: SPOR domain-containing protein [Prevotella sp.]|nr:SPOR domain-containing protein [Prevotella sp.]